ncbi:MAG: hypothetical protein FJ363_10290, partial [Gemmatimonadetes bacterium]|nr:hypothetical protein [Gemmatimonadota bacterium]
MMRVEVRPTRLTAPLVASAFLHVGVAALLLMASRAGGSVSLPPMYKVELIAAPPGPPAIGEVTDAPADDAARAKAPPKPAPDA